ncbi:hypothetical protein [Chryseobacterium balustinum]|uniref:T9SS C-terminal target domain-containing protein n=1 Tax=Chryseobacterium balustinum TaxID=246 RepID=A0AAX2IFB1_9FLAO|nr:hypothetical protein [Chryseobacterium balustinum]AZB28577.1 hypothetical protein EB354_04465 [Chryseobacterium balustinum]SKB77467.1 hypothetical protein SAMN05421800_10873 [Chryseobacterium balustinum]SQA86590.1 Uncharacterised protein [Chryseobacterium balustinum]
MKKIILLFTLFFFQTAFSQQAEIFKLKKYRIAVLNDSIQETSGLNFFDGKLYTFNDSGNPAELYEIEKNSGKILNVLKTNAENKDWEALTNDGKNFYIGDFGNNAGTRKHLKIYKIPFRNNQLQNDSMKAISFYYPEQEDFTSRNINTDFDLESMIYLNGKIHIFTKEWASKSTTHFTLDPENLENQAAEKVESFRTGFMISDAYYFNKKLYVVGYTKKTEVFLDVFNESEPGIFFKEKSRHFYLGSALTIGQIEGIAVDETGIYISGERFYSPIKKTKPFFYFIPKEKLKL